MRLVRQTPEELALRHRPVVLAATLAAVALALVGTALWAAGTGAWVKAGVALAAAAGVAVPALRLGAERVEVIFDAAAGTCRVQSRTLAGPVEEVYPLDSILRAEVETLTLPDRGWGTGGGAHRVALLLAPGRPGDLRPLGSGYSGGSAAAGLAARIDGWLEAARSRGAA